MKIVVLSSTRSNTIARVCELLRRVGKIPVVAQPVIPARKVSNTPSMTHVYHLAEVAARAGVGEIAIIPQVHKLIRVP